MTFIPEGLTSACRGSAERRSWLEQLPETIRQLEDRWRLSCEHPFDSNDISCAWVARVRRGDGDRAYDATQHLFNCLDRMLVDPEATMRRFADLLEVDYERIRLWMFARAAAEPRDSWNDRLMILARALA